MGRIGDGTRRFEVFLITSGSTKFLYATKEFKSTVRRGKSGYRLFYNSKRYIPFLFTRITSLNTEIKGRTVAHCAVGMYQCPKLRFIPTFRL
jgi:hypothetical protein